MRILTTGVTKINRKLIGNVTGKDLILNKPSHESKVLWGSTEIQVGDNYSSAWKEYTRKECCTKDFGFGVSYKIYQKAKVLEIETVDDFKGICAWNGALGYIIDYDKVNGLYDAIHVTQEAIDSIEELKAWTVESWLIINPKAIGFETVERRDNL